MFTKIDCGEVVYMIVYNDILGKLKESGYTTYRIKKEKILPGSVVQRLRSGKPITTDTIDVICNLLDCQPGDLISFKKDTKEDV